MKRRVQRGWRVAGVVLVCSLVTSCFVPMSYWDKTSRHNITPSTAAALRPGEMKLEDVLLQLGEPDFALDDGRHIGYRWTRVKGLLVVGAMYVGSASEVTRTATLELTFDEQGLLAGVQVVSKRLHID